MKKKFLTILTIFTLLFSISITAMAKPIGDSGKDPAPQDSSSSSDSGGGGDGEPQPEGDGDGDSDDGDGDDDYEPHLPEIMSYTPVVTALHSVNGMLASAGDAVYFIPMLDEFPVDLKTTCADLTSEDGKEHKFAIVYDGYFDNEVVYNRAQNSNSDTADVTRLQTSKRVYSQSDNSRCLNLLGYDLLLANEEAAVRTNGEFVDAEYHPTLVGTAPLTAKTVIMDLYKAVGVYEWDIKIIYGIDDTLAVDTSPIQQQLMVLTNDLVEGGIVTDEGATYVWATRTNPAIYWERAKRDAIFDGGAHKYTKATYVGNDVSVTFSKNETQTVTMGEFCQLAKAFMELYGEPVLTADEIQLMIQAYSLEIPTQGVSEEEKDAIMYLAAKGVLDPTDVEWNKSVTFSDIEPLLLRIADDDSRLTFKYNLGMSNLMNQVGFVKADLADANYDFDRVEEITNPFDSDYYDYYIEAADGYTNFYLNTIQGINLDSQENMHQTGYKDTDIRQPDGSILHPDGTITYPDGSTLNLDGTITYPDGSILRTDGTTLHPDGTVTDEEGNVIGTEEPPVRQPQVDNTQQAPSTGTNNGTLNGYVTDQENSSLTSNNNGGIASVPTFNMIQEDEKVYMFACDKLLVAGADNVNTSTGSGYFEYKGLRELEDKFYYHFQISRSLSSITISYDYNPTYERMYDITSYTLPDALGGVYNIDEDGNWVKQTFDEAEFSDIFVDDDRLVNDYNMLSTTESFLASNWHWFKVDYTDAAWSNMQDTDSILSYNGKNLLAKGAILEVLDKGDQGAGVVAGSTTRLDNHLVTYFARTSSNAGGLGYTYVVFQTDMDWKEFQKYLNSNSGTDQYDGYYRAEDGTILASYDYLKSKRLASSMGELAAGEGIYITTTGANVVLRNDLHCVIIGDTYLSIPNEVLYYKDNNNKYYINIKACLGWTQNYIPVVINNSVVPLYNVTGIRGAVAWGSNTWNVSNFFPNSSFNVGYLTVSSKTNGYAGYANAKGIPMTSTNPLGCYMVVMDTQGGSTDHLFVWHLQDVNVNGSIKHLNDDGARGTFQSLTGLNIGSVSNKYVLKHYTLDRSNNNNPTGFRYLNQRFVNSYTDVDVSMGYIYTPKAYTSIYDAFEEYCGGSESCTLPLANMNGKLVNLNLNTCTDVAGNDQLPIGTLPGNLTTTNKYKNSMLKLTASGKDVEEVTATYDTLDHAVLYAAPVGIFQTFKGLGKQSIDGLSGTFGTVYYGSSKVTVRKKQLVVGNMALEFSKSANAIASYLGGGSSIYVICEEASSLGDVLEDTLEEIGLIVTDPETLVDWGAYKFRRLVQNIDEWSTIVLIFVLNIFPRIAMFLFFVLMLLSLIKNVKFWRRFCENQFDIYSFLTMGKQNVNTVDTKRIMIISMICLAIFFVIMDGQLFNFIIWLCRLFIAITQR